MVPHAHPAGRNDPALGRLVRRGLEAQRHVVELADNGRDGLDLALGGDFDVLVLDWMLPAMTGIEVLSRLRAEGCAVPVLMLTARDAVPDRVQALMTGADDYLVKPFDLAELQARVVALGRRRANGPMQAALCVGALELDLNRRAAIVAGRALTRDQIRQQVWGNDAEPSGNAVNIYVHFLRRKLKAYPGAPHQQRARPRLLPGGRPPCLAGCAGN